MSINTPLNLSFVKTYGTESTLSLKEIRAAQMAKKEQNVDTTTSTSGKKSLIKRTGEAASRVAQASNNIANKVNPRRQYETVK